jgi:hypothetical protein
MQNSENSRILKILIQIRKGANPMQSALRIETEVLPGNKEEINRDLQAERNAWDN